MRLHGKMLYLLNSVLDYLVLYYNRETKNSLHITGNHYLIFTILLFYGMNKGAYDIFLELWWIPQAFPSTFTTNILTKHLVLVIFQLSIYMTFFLQSNLVICKGYQCCNLSRTYYAPDISYIHLINMCCIITLLFIVFWAQRSHQ